MKVWQAVGCAIVAFALFIGLIVGAVFWATGGIVEAADDFFAAAAEGDYDKAHALTSRAMRAEKTPVQLELFLTASGLNEVTDTSWNSRSIKNTEGRIEGTLTTESKGKVPVVIELVSEDDVWRVSLIEPQKLGLQTSGSAIGTGDQ
jgi:hypothetical protein